MKQLLLITVLCILIMSCTQTPQTEQTSSDLRQYFAHEDSGMQTGGVKMIPIQTPKGTFNVWTKRFGNNPRIKVLLLHGGPGATHEYFESFESFLPVEGIEFIYYDQLGSAYSDQPHDTSLWHLDRFVDEVEQVRKALDLNRDNFYLLGSSWGGILALEYALKYQDNIKALIISNMMCSAPEYDKYADEVLAKQMDPLILDTIRMLESRGEFDNPKYMELLMPNFYAKHLVHIPLEKWPEPVMRMFSKLNQEVYVIMQGPSEFGISGRLERWDRKADLPKIKVPTLTIGGQYDTMDPEHMKWMSTQVQNGRFLYCPNGGHLAMWDDQQVYMNGLIQFLKDVDSGRSIKE